MMQTPVKGDEEPRLSPWRSPRRKTPSDNKTPPPRDDMSAKDIDKKREAARRASAESIRPKCGQWVLHSWKPKEKKPMKPHLLQVVEKFFPGVRCKTWEAQKLADFLHDNERKVVFAIMHLCLLMSYADACVKAHRHRTLHYRFGVR